MVKGGLMEKRSKEDSLWEKLSREEIRGGDDEFLETDRWREERGSWWRARGVGGEVKSGMWQMRIKVH
jgi:hypothetical protein